MRREAALEDGMRRFASSRQPISRHHFRLADTSLNVLFNFGAIAATEPMITSAINDAINAYSTAVAPDSLARNILIRTIIAFSQPLNARAKRNAG